MTEDNGMTRRQVIKLSAIGGAVLLGGSALAACTTGSDSTSTSPNQPKPGKRGGTLRVAHVGGAGDILDAHVAASGATVTYENALYSGLTGFDHDAKVVLVLAEEITPNKDATEWTIRLRSGLTFHDGRPVTSEDVAATIRRVLDPKTGSIAAYAAGAINPKTIKIVDDRTLVLPLNYPDAFLADHFAKFFGIVPKDYDPKKPIGAGPFKLKSFDPAREVVFDRFDGYYREGLPYLDELRLVVFSSASAVINSVISGATDGTGNIGPSQVALVKGRSDLSLVQSETGFLNQITMWTDKGPFADVRVRQAMKLMVDREQMLKVVYGGFGRIGNDMPGITNEGSYASNIPQTKHDPERAKALLKAAGASDLATTFTTSPLDAFTLPMTEVFAQQAKAVGVDIKIDKVSDPGTFFSKSYGQTPLQPDYWSSETLPFFASLSQLPGAPVNNQHWNNKKAADLYKQARSTLDTSLQNELLKEYQQIYHDDGGWIVWGFLNTHDVLNKKFTGMVRDAVGGGINGSRFEEIGLSS